MKLALPALILLAAGVAQTPALPKLYTYYLMPGDRAYTWGSLVVQRPILITRDASGQATLSVDQAAIRQPRMVKESFEIPAPAVSPYTYQLAHLIAPGSLPIIVFCSSTGMSDVQVPAAPDYVSRTLSVVFDAANVPTGIQVLYWTLE